MTNTTKTNKDDEKLTITKNKREVTKTRKKDENAFDDTDEKMEQPKKNLA